MSGSAAGSGAGSSRGSMRMPALGDDIRASVRRIGPLDWLMLVLALLSIVLVGWALIQRPPPAVLRWIFVADYLICALFAAQFFWRWRTAAFSAAFLARNWYELLGMIPLQPTISQGYWFGVLRILILLARFAIAANRAFGHEFTHRLVVRAKTAVVDQISGALTMAVLDRVADVLVKGTYTRNVSRVLEENQKELRSMVLEKLKEDRQTGRLSRLPFYNEIVEGVIDAALRVMEQVLKDRRTDVLVSDMLRENLQQIREAVARQEEAIEQAKTRTDPEQPSHPQPLP